MIQVGIIVGSTRPGGKALSVAEWVRDTASTRRDAAFEVVDIQDFNLPLLDEPLLPSRHRYTRDHTRRWSETIARFDAFVFVTPEYNHGPPGALKNAIDFLYSEWNNKAAGFVSYGSAGGSRAVEQLRLTMAELQIADVRAQLLLYLSRDFENFETFLPAPEHARALGTVLDQLVAWAGALRALRRRAVAA